ncbi:IS1 family transposase, partial [Escherichia coli]
MASVSISCPSCSATEIGR